MPKAFGLIEESKLDLPYEELINDVEDVVAQFSYSRSNQPDFLGFFQFLTSYFQECEEQEILRKLTEILSSIAGYKLGLRVAEVFILAQSILLKLLSSPNVNNMKTAVDYCRKVSRVIGPRIVLEKFVVPNISVTPCQRGLAAIATLAINDNPKFEFVSSDFDKSWVIPLSEITRYGQRFLNAIQKAIPDYNFDGISAYSGITNLGRPPSVPVKFNLTEQVNTNINLMEALTTSASQPIKRTIPSSARPPIPPRILNRKNSSVNNSFNGEESNGSIIFKLTSRQQQIREFVDEPFEDSDHFSLSIYIQQCRSSLSSTDWEERSASYNQAKRILRYSPDSFSDDDIHLLVTATLEDVTSQRSALALSSIGALSEAFSQKPSAMSFELGRVLPALLKLHQKTAQFFESALTSCMEIIIDSMSPKRFLSILIANCDTKSTKVQTAISKYIRASLEKQQSSPTPIPGSKVASRTATAGTASSDRFFSKKCNELRTLIVILNKLLKGAATETREAAKDSVRILSDLYGESFNSIVDSALEPRAAAEFYRTINYR